MKKRLHQAMQCIRHFVSAILSWLASAGLWMAVSGIGGSGLVVAGVFLLCGLAWSCIAAGTFLLLFAALIFRGMTSG